MKQCLPVLCFLLGLGNCFSFSQIASPKKYPFDRYLAGARDGLSWPSLEKFATECNVDVSKIQPRYAVGPGSSFTQVKDLATGLRALDTDFYSTVEVWTTGNRVLVAMWANSDDIGSEVRYFECFVPHELMQAEVIQWNVPVSHSQKVVSWGYSRRWERGVSGRMEQTKAEFVDEFEHPIPTPKLDAASKKSLSWLPSLGPLNELKLPPALLR